jgi:hypothetical protein
MLYIVGSSELTPLDDVKGDNVLLAQHKSIIIKKNHNKKQISEYLFYQKNIKKITKQMITFFFIIIYTIIPQKKPLLYSYF